jgi:flagellar basal-body rod modification protein FlgD
VTTINPTALPAATTAGSSAPTANPNATLGQNDFLKLMIAQLQAQDPLQPANTNEYVSELAQFTQVEQTTNLANAGELSSAVQLIGRTVAYNNPAGGSATGVVQSVQTTAAGTSVTIEGVGGIKLTSITEVN